jgi:hypothetical protein
MAGRPASLSRVLEISMTIAAAGVVATVLFSATMSSSGRERTRSPLTTLQSSEGLRAESVPGLDYGRSGVTVVLVIRSTCPYCTNSLPAFRQICDAPERTGWRVRCVAVSSEGEAVLKKYLESHDLRSVATFGVLPGTPLTNVTPRLQIVGTDGVVKREWLGEIDQTVHGEIVGVLKSLQIAPSIEEGLQSPLSCGQPGHGTALTGGRDASPYRPEGLGLPMQGAAPQARVSFAARPDRGQWHGWTTPFPSAVTRKSTETVIAPEAKLPSLGAAPH